MKKIVPSLWFGDNNCEEAINYYVSVIPNSHIQNIVKYPDESLDEHFKGMAGKVITAEFTLNGQKFFALDGGPYFHFDESISMTIECDDQDEIDYFGISCHMLKRQSNVVGLRINLDFHGR